VPIRERGPGWTYRPDMRPPTVFGEHQPGIATPQREHALLVAYDAPADLPGLLEAWTEEAERRMRAGGQTVTLGLGAGVFNANTRLCELPPFPGDALDPALCGGDLCVLISSDAPVEPLPGAAIRWLQRARHTERGALGFREGTLNLRRPRDLDRHVWITGRERTAMLGGTFLVVRRIQVLDAWHRLPQDEQERIIGRDKRTGAPLTGRRLYDAPVLDRLDPHAHIRVAAKAAILRRGYDTEDGLLFLAFTNDPRRRYIPLQQRLAEHDALHPHTRHIGSAVFAIPPGAKPKSFIAQPLL
jgi:deferrochelatase/peroxidase EfeB